MKRKSIEALIEDIKSGFVRIFKSPKKILIVLGVWYIETPVAIAMHLHKNLMKMYLNPVSTFINFFHFSVIGGLIKFNILIFIIFALLCVAMHIGKNDYEEGKILEWRKLLLIRDMMVGKEKDNINWSDRGDYGTAKWIETEQQVKNLKGIVEINDMRGRKHESAGVILGYLRGSEKLITLPENSFLNQNIAVFGSSGSMKSRSYIIPNILNLMNSGESMVITDPKGGATRSCLKRVSTQPPMKNIA